jgi:hypothetical protein
MKIVGQLKLVSAFAESEKTKKFQKHELALRAAAYR